MFVLEVAALNRPPLTQDVSFSVSALARLSGLQVLLVQDGANWLRPVFGMLPVRFR